MRKNSPFSRKLLIGETPDGERLLNNGRMKQKIYQCPLCKRRIPEDERIRTKDGNRPTKGFNNRQCKGKINDYIGEK